LAVLTGGVMAANGKCECEERAGWFGERGSHRLPPLHSYIRCISAPPTFASGKLDVP
jgi:hypothetical protein